MSFNPNLAAPAASHASIAGANSIAHARFRDLRTVSKLQRRAFRPPLAYGFATLFLLWALPHVQFLIYTENGEIIGCAIGDTKGGQSRVINICVDPVARRRGIGSRMLKSLESALVIGDMVLMVEAGNAGAQALYRQHGYLPVGVSRDYYGRGLDGIWMQKQRSAQTTPKIRI